MKKTIWTAVLLWICVGAMLLFCFHTNGILPGSTMFPETVKTSRVLPWAMNHLCGAFLLAAVAATVKLSMKRKVKKLTDL